MCIFLCVQERERREHFMEKLKDRATCHFSALSGNIRDSDCERSAVGCGPNDMKAGQRSGV